MICSKCEGYGYLEDDDTGEPNQPVGGVRCPICNGTGEQKIYKPVNNSTSKGDCR